MAHKHLSGTATTGELLEAMFSVGSVLHAGEEECQLLEDVTQQCREDHEWEH
jgi:hypothetical protein